MAEHRRSPFMGRGKLSRRELIRRSTFAGLGLVGAALIGCGADESVTSTGPTRTPQTGASPATPAPVATAKRGGILATHISGDPSNLDPHTYIVSGDEPLLRTVFQNLVAADATGYTERHSLSSSWEQASDVEFIFSLRPNMKFHDGTDVTAEVVVWNLQDLVDPARSSPRRAAFSAVQTAEAVDDLTVRIVIDRPNASFFGDLNHPSSGIMSRDSAERLGPDGIKGNPVGTGPFKLKEWRRGSSIEVESFGEYWDRGADGEALPYLAGVRWDILPDASVRAEAFGSGRLDILRAVPPAQFDRFARDPRFVLHGFVGARVSSCFLNPMTEPFINKDLARAVWAAGDRKALISLAHGGRGEPAYGGISPGMHAWAYSGDALDVPRGPDPQLVRALLDRAGVPDGFKFTMLTSSPVGDTVQVLQSQLAEFGMIANIDAYDVATVHEMFWTTERDKHSILFNGGMAQSVDPHLKLNLVHSSNGAYHPARGTDFAKDDEYFQEMDRLLTRANSTYDREERATAYKELEEANGRYAGWIPWVHLEETTAVSSRVKDINLGPDNMGQLHETWIDA